LANIVLGSDYFCSGSRKEGALVNKKMLSESDICDRYISPALVQSGWDETRWRREYYFTAGRIIVRGKLVARGKKKKADYLLFYKSNIPIAIIEAKNNTHSLGAGMQQGLGYSNTLDIPFVFSSNGDGFLFHDKTGNAPQIETILSLDEFPSPEELWERYKVWKGLTEQSEELVTSQEYQYLSEEQPRYYQQLAINRTIEAIARGQKRVLLAMATGTGKTRTAFNIIWRLWKTRKAKRVLFLADRNILVDQTMINDFKPFGSVMTKLNRSLVDKDNGKVDTSYEIYLALYQAIIGGEDSEAIYDKFPKDFFDVVVIDECHRGSAADDATWKTILNYFDSAIQIGMTATPRETKYVSNIGYFGDPVYSYSLKQGIDDGFLAPFKVVRVDLDLDLQGWRPEAGMLDDKGSLIVDRTYNQNDINKDIVFPERDKVVAQKISEFLHNTDPMNKTIVFCSNIDHAERMRQALVNDPLNAELVAKDNRYVMRITGDNEEGKNELDNFIDPKRPYPVIATTSKLMSTGVDAQTCQLIVLDQKIQSMTEFKQIIGRGTRLRPDYGKYFFTIIDFKKATELFSDPEWDGPAISIKEIDKDGNEKVVNPDPMSENEDAEIDEVIVGPSDNSDVESELGRRFVVSGVQFKVIAERVQYYDKDGKLITESLRDFTRKAVGQEFKSLNQFIKRWNEAERKQVIIEELLEKGVILEALEEAVGRDLDPFDLICHIAFDQPALTRRERADEVKKRDVFSMYGDQAREVLGILLDKYADQGLETIERIDVLRLDPFTKIGTPIEIVKSFGGRDKYLEAVQKLENSLYATSA
jgi:type I restriction enzyme, R subunit